ncbi:MAG: HAD hydrolase family protein [Pseudomonadales bacterium]|nr:HAD hydrolase family protein [Pseudomonadales bacterium]
MTRILFHDIDGCLNTVDGRNLPFECEPLDSMQQAALAEFGRLFDKSPIDVLVLNTGRSLQASLGIAEAINSRGLKYLLAEHGAIGYQLDQRRLLDFEQIAGALPEVNKTYKTVANISALIAWYRDTGAKLLAQQIGVNPVLAPKQANLTLDIPRGIDPEHLQQRLQSLIASNTQLSQHRFVYHLNITDGYLDVMAEVDKGDGMRLICMLESVTKGETYAVGNGLNDMPMFDQADNILCPANSEAELKAYCVAQGGLLSKYAYIEASNAWLRAFIKNR